MSFDPFLDLIASYIVIVVAFAAIGFLLWLLTAIARWIVFQKAGQAGWKSLIPVYDTFVLLRIIQRPAWWGYLIVGLSVVQIVLTYMQDGGSDNSTLLELMSSIATIISLIFSVRITHGLSRFFNRGIGFTVGLLFFPYIFYPILAFGSSIYHKAQ